MKMCRCMGTRYMKAQRLYPKGLLKRYSASAYMQEPIAAIPHALSGQALAPNINAPTAMTGLRYLVVFGARSAKAHLAAPATWRLMFSWALWDFVNAAHKAETRRFCCTNSRAGCSLLPPSRPCPARGQGVEGHQCSRSGACHWAHAGLWLASLLT